MTVPYIFASATSSIPLSELDANFATPITLGSSSLVLGGTYTTIAGLTLSASTLVNAALGTPLSGILTNCTGYTYANLSGTVPIWNQNTTGNAATATIASTATNATNATNANFATSAGSATNAESLTTTNFSITESGGKLYFAYRGADIASLDSAGNFTALANVTAYGTP